MKYISIDVPESRARPVGRTAGGSGVVKWQEFQNKWFGGGPGSLGANHLHLPVPMAVIRLETKIKASAHTCFDLSRSVDAHLSSMEHTKERAVAGRTSGLCELNDTITWEAKHLGVKQYLPVKITKMEPYTMFEDVMIKGAFKSMHHQHSFEEKNGVTIMRDVFAYETPGWIFGKLFDLLVLERYMTKLLGERNEVLKRMAESVT